MGQVLRCTLYAEVLKPYRVTPSKTEDRPLDSGSPHGCLFYFFPLSDMYPLSWTHKSKY